MEDPSRETVIEILRNIGIGEGCISEFLEMLFGLPKEDSILGEASLEIEDYPINDFKDSENLGEEIETKNNEVLDLKKHEEVYFRITRVNVLLVHLKYLLLRNW